MLFIFAIVGAPVYRLAPIALLILWFVASIVNRVIIDYTTPKQVMETALLEAAKRETTLILASGDLMRIKALADGPLRSIVFVSPPRSETEPVGIKEWTIGHGTDCADEQRLWESGRTDECVSTKTLGAIPDGLELKTYREARVANLSPDCCIIVEALLRRGDKSERVMTWSIRQVWVLPYVPMFGTWLRNRPTSIWAFGTGPLQLVHYGEETTAESAAKQIFGVDPAAQLLPPKLSAGEWERRVTSVPTSAQGKGCNKAITIAHIAEAEGVVTDKIIQSAVDCLGVYSEFTMPRGVGAYFGRLGVEDRRVMGDKLVRRLAMPCACGDCCQHEGDWDFSRLPADAATDADAPYRKAAVETFITQSNLKLWQYKGLLYLAKGGDESRARAFSAALLSLNDLPSRILAFAHAYQATLTDAEIDMLRQRLGDIPKAERYALFLEIRRRTAGSPSPATALFEATFHAMDASKP